MNENDLLPVGTKVCTPQGHKGTVVGYTTVKTSAGQRAQCLLEMDRAYWYSCRGENVSVICVALHNVESRR